MQRQASKDKRERERERGVAQTVYNSPDRRQMLIGIDATGVSAFPLIDENRDESMLHRRGGQATGETRPSGRVVGGNTRICWQKKPTITTGLTELLSCTVDSVS